MRIQVKTRVINLESHPRTIWRREIHRRAKAGSSKPSGQVWDKEVSKDSYVPP